MRINKFITKNLKFFYLFSIIFFFIFYLKLHKYGLPYFINNDETAGMKNLLYFYGFFSYANQNIVEPFFYAFLNFLSTGFLILLKNIIFWNYSLTDLKDFIYLNPDVLFGLGRISSTIFCCFSLFCFYLISKKLNLNKFYVLVSFLALSFSYLFVDIAIVLGKNSLLLFLFLSQYYFFIKYSKKIEKFNLKSYVILAFLGSLAWGVNYWAASPSIYAILYLHIEKYRFKKLSNIFLFGLIFFIFGILLNYFVTGHEIFSLFLNPEKVLSENNRFGTFLNDFINGFKIINNFEKGVLPILFLLILVLLFFFKIEKKKFIIFNLILIFEPIFLFAVADKIYPQLRYFGPSFFLIYILIGYLINLISVKNSKFAIILCVLISLNYLYFSIEKISILLNVKKIINNKFIEFKILDDYSDKDLIYISEYMIYRENIKTLEIYKNLLEKKMVSLNPVSDNRNSLSEISKKLKIIKRAEINNIYPSSKNYVFYSNEYLINDIDSLMNFFELNFNYIIVKKSNKNLVNILQKRFEKEKIYVANEFGTLRTLTKYLEQNFDSERLKNKTQLGSTMIVFKLK
jgi:hypothetical protein